MANAISPMILFVMAKMRWEYARKYLARENSTMSGTKVADHDGCGGTIVWFSSFTNTRDIETPVCTKCSAIGKAERTDIRSQLPRPEGQGMDGERR